MYELLISIGLSILFGIWVLIDAKQRNDKAGKWAFSAFILPPIFVPNYFSKRNLKKGEIRKGGANWHALRNFALYWSFFMLLIVLFTSVSQFSFLGSVREDAFGLSTLALLWGIPAGGALLLGIILKKPSKIEEGPTGSLVVDS